MTGARVLLCDADGCLFPSEEPAFEASTEVTNRVLAELGIDRRFTSGELRRRAVGRNFRGTITDLASEHGAALDDDALAGWVAEERRQVTAHLERELRPDPEVREALAAIAGRTALALVSSSALARLDACLRATGLDRLFPPDARFSAEDSLPEPRSKPDPAVYALAGERLGVTAADALAVEDAPAGVASAVGAGFPVAGQLVFVAPGEREERAAALRAEGAERVVSSWWELAAMLDAAPAVPG